MRRRHKKSRLPRGSQGVYLSTTCGAPRTNHPVWYDLDVPLIIPSKNKSINDSSDVSFFRYQHHPLLHRLYSTGYSVVALSHTVYGKIDRQRDAAANRFPSPLVFPFPNSENIHENIHSPRNKFRILKRLNIVLEQVSDLAYYTLPLNSTVTTNSTGSPYSSCRDLLQDYDIIAMCPRNDSVFSAICTTAHLLHVDILTLDYTSGRGGVQLPFSMKSSLLSTAVSHGIFFEIPYAPAILDLNKRKALVQTVKQFQMALATKTMSSMCPLVLSSGIRCQVKDTKEMGPFAFRLPGDLQNFFHVVLGFSIHMAGKLMSQNSQQVEERGKGWKIVNKSEKKKIVGYSICMEKMEDISYMERKEEDCQSVKKAKHTQMDEKIYDDDDDDDDLEDGFLRLG